MSLPPIALALMLSGAHAGPVQEAATWDLPGLKLVDEIDCAGAGEEREFVEFPEGASRTEEILGTKARSLPNEPGSTTKYFAYKIGKGKGLKAGQAYLLEIDYPEDEARSMFFLNHGAGVARGLQIGATVGDALHPPFVSLAPESLDIPLAGEYRTWRNLFHLHDRTSDIKRANGKGPRPFLSEDGFWVIVAHLSHKNAPDSRGAAVSRIRLYEVPDENALALSIHYPPAGLPRRHLFWREEMADGAVAAADDEAQREVKDIIDWYEYKAKQMEFLGFNTYALDMLEFGSNQGWDSAPGGADWYFQSNRPYAWEAILDRLEKYPGFSVLPYYEYSGSLGKNGLGNQKRAIPLSPGLANYTHIRWAEKGRADLLDPDTLEDFKKVLKLTIVRFKDKAKFLGAWLRPRMSQLPISFSEKGLKLFSEEANGGTPVSREDLIQSKPLYDKYIAWWMLKRKEFFNKVRDYLREEGVEDALLIYTADATESGVKYQPPNEPLLIAEKPEAYEKFGEKTTTMETALKQERHRKALTLPTPTWGEWEWNHAVPMYDPENYKDNEGVLPTYTFNSTYTVLDPEALDLFRTRSGLGIVRHFALNEHTTSIGEERATRNEVLGYFVADVERAGPYVRMSEALAVANGDPWHIGYLAGGRFTSGSPEYVRAFNQAYLALPALPSRLLDKAANDPAVVVREIETDGYGTYLAVVNTARADKEVEITLPQKGVFRDAAVDRALAEDADRITLKMHPFQLRAIWYDARPGDAAAAMPDAVETDEGKTVAIEPLANDRGRGPLKVSETGTPAHGKARIVGDRVEYTPEPGFYGTDSFRYTVSDGASQDKARVSVTVRDQAKRHDLGAWRLTGSRIGSLADGSARELPGQEAELFGYGRGMKGNEDSLCFEHRGVVGDFEATGKVAEVTGPGGALAGLQFRQANAADSQMVALAAHPGGKVEAFSRDEVGGAVTRAAVAGGPWLRLRREGQALILLTSEDGKQFDEVGRRLLPGLGVSGEIGLFLTGGDRDVKARALAQGLTIEEKGLGEHVLLAQDFSESDSPDAYHAAGAGGNLFDKIGAPENGGKWLVTPDGRLQFEGAAGMNEGAVVSRHSPFPREPAVLKASFDLGVKGTRDFADLGAIEWGSFKDSENYQGVASNLLAGRLTIKAAGSGSFFIKGDKGKAPTMPADGSSQKFTIYINRSGRDGTYTGPDGEVYTLGDRKIDLWANGKQALAGEEIPADLSSETMGSFRVRLAKTAGLRFALDNIVLEDSFEAAAAGPSASNRPVTAQADAFTVPERVTTELRVAENDRDPDNGPKGLHVTGVTPPANGRAEPAGAVIRYTPRPGFVGADAFTYTVSDGVAEAKAEVRVTVTGAPGAADLTTLGMKPVILGEAKGSGRVLGNGAVEVQGDGRPLGGTEDHLVLQAERRDGDFAIKTQVVEMSALGDGAWLGVMMREDAKAGGRAAVLALNKDLRPIALHRTTGGAALERKGSGLSYPPPAAWLQLVRQGDNVAFRVSSDGRAFHDIARASFAGLSRSTEVGLFAIQAYGRFSGLQKSESAEPGFRQDFSSSAKVEDYISVQPGNALFDDISAEAQGGRWMITEDGRLRIERPGGSEAAAGLARTTSLPGNPTALIFRFDFSLEPDTASWSGEPISIDFGSWSKPMPHGQTGSYDHIFARLVVRATNGGQFQFRFGTGASRSFPAGEVCAVFAVLNNSGQEVAYPGPDRQTHRAGNQRLSLWVNDELVIDNVERGGFRGDRMANFRIRLACVNSLAATFDNVAAKRLGLGTNE